jgi:hypothetical protein
LFDYAEIDFAKSFSFDDIEHIESFVDGVVVEKATSGSGTSGVNKETSEFGDIVLKFQEHEFGQNVGDAFYGITLQGAVKFKLDIKTDIDIGSSWEDFGMIYDCDFGMTGKTTGSVTGKITVKKKWTGEAKKILSFYGAPVFMMVGAIPVVFTPQLDIFMGIIGEAELAATFTPSVTMTATAGLKYTRAEGWDPYFEHSLDGGFGWKETNVYGKVQLDLNLLSPQPTLKLYGVTGPYAKFHAPYFRIAAQLQTTPPEFIVTGSIGARAYVGAEINIFGRSLAKYELSGTPIFNVLFQIYEAKWPLGNDVWGSIKCIVTDSVTDEVIPYPRANIVNVGKKFTPFDWHSFDGTVNFSSELPGTYYVYIYQEGYHFSLERVELSAGENAEIPVVLTPGPLATEMLVELTYERLPVDVDSRWWPRVTYEHPITGDIWSVDPEARGSLGSLPFMLLTGNDNSLTKQVIVSSIIQPKADDVDSYKYYAGFHSDINPWDQEFAPAWFRVFLDNVMVLNVFLDGEAMALNPWNVQYPGLAFTQGTGYLSVTNTKYAWGSELRDPQL